MQYILNQKEYNDLVVYKENIEPEPTIKFEKTIKALLDPVDVRVDREPASAYPHDDYIVFKLNLEDIDNEILMILKSKGIIQWNTK